MKKSILTVLALTVLLMLLLGTAAAVSAESLYIKKVVSVVYDDSSSMYGDKWAYANYAMQAFGGMLNSEDQLYITYMSHTQLSTNYNPEEINLSKDEIQGSVDSIRGHSDSGSTPYDAVKTAFDKLESIKDENPNTQYWLVVITDGSFDEMASMPDKKREKFLNEEFEGFAKTKMANGSTPQITFLAIGNSVQAPDNDPQNGIHVYKAKTAGEIIGEMSKMADKISGRTRLEGKDITILNTADDEEKSIVQISSSIPLLNIAVFVQESDANIESAIYGKEIDIPLTREALLGYPEYDDLVGGAYLLGDSQTVIGRGTYNITFNKKIEKEQIVILFEPALETRMTITVNGKKASDEDLENLRPGDKISVSCKIYEMGTDNEISPSLLPPGTKFEISVTEEDGSVEKKSGEDMVFSDYAVKAGKSEVKASVTIEGFKPIEYTETLDIPDLPPLPPPPVYTMTASFGNDIKNVKLDEIPSNEDLTVCFTVYADGVQITDENEVRALGPNVVCSPSDNMGSITYSSDGKIIFTPKIAGAYATGAGSFDVEVICTLADGTKASETYTVLVADYQVVAVDNSSKIKKTEFFENKTGVSFYITKDGNKLGKKDIEKGISVNFNEAHKGLKYVVDISDDGTITIIPYSDKEYKVTVLSWFINEWVYYLSFEGSDLKITLNHSYGNATNTIDVVEEDIIHWILNVLLPIIFKLLIIAEIICIIGKPRFCKNAVVYSGTIVYDGYENAHEVKNLIRTNLSKYNKLRYRLAPNLKSKKITAGMIEVSAARDGQIFCHETGPAFKGTISFVHESSLKHPRDILEYCRKFSKNFFIEPFSPIRTIKGASVGVISPTNEANPTYFVVGATTSSEDGPFLIKSGKIFVYLTM